MIKDSDVPLWNAILTKDDVNLVFAHLIKEFRKKNGITQVQLADQIGISRVSIVNFEKGLQKPSLWWAFRLSKALGFSLDEINNVEAADIENRREKQVALKNERRQLKDRLAQINKVLGREKRTGDVTPPATKDNNSGEM